jgi:hypothetical protein
MRNLLEHDRFADPHHFCGIMLPPESRSCRALDIS